MVEARYRFIHIDDILSIKIISGDVLILLAQAFHKPTLVDFALVVNNCINTILPMYSSSEALNFATHLMSWQNIELSSSWILMHPINGSSIKVGRVEKSTIGLFSKFHGPYLMKLH